MQQATNNRVSCVGQREPKASLVVPVWNRSASLHRALASVLQQSERDLELIVVDNGSDDADAVTEVVVGLSDPRVTLVRLPTNSGPGGGRNAGFLASKAPLVGFLDSDDEIAPDWLALMSKPFDEATVGFVTCGLRKVGADGRVVLERMPSLGEGLAAVTPALFQAGTMLLRRSLFDVAGRYDERFWFSENTELGLRVLRAANEAGLNGVAIHTPLLTWHVNEGPRRYTPVLLESAELFLTKHSSVLQADPVTHLRYLSVAGVEAVRRRQLSRARRHFQAALKLKPTVRTLGRYLVAWVPVVAFRLWKP